MFDFFDLYGLRVHPNPWYRATHAEQTARDAASKARELEREIDELGRRVDKLTLANLALWSILKARLGLDDEELRSKIQEIDLLDGKLDGRVTELPQQCPTCRRTMSVRHQKCLYCGAP